MYRFILFYFVLYICIYVAPWSCEARHLVPLYVHTCSGMTIKLNLNLNLNLNINNCLVQLPNLISEDYGGCRANHWYNPLHSPGTVLIQSEQKGCKISLNPLHPAHSLFELLSSGRCYRAPEWPDTGTVSSLRQSISRTLDNNYGTHTIYTLIYLTHILSLHLHCT